MYSYRELKLLKQAISSYCSFIEKVTDPYQLLKHSTNFPIQKPSRGLIKKVRKKTKIFHFYSSIITLLGKGYFNILPFIYKVFTKNKCNSLSETIIHREVLQKLYYHYSYKQPIPTKVEEIRSEIQNKTKKINEKIQELVIEQEIISLLGDGTSLNQKEHPPQKNQINLEELFLSEEFEKMINSKIEINNPNIDPIIHSSQVFTELYLNYRIIKSLSQPQKERVYIRHAKVHNSINNRWSEILKHKDIQFHFWNEKFESPLKTTFVPPYSPSLPYHNAKFLKILNDLLVSLSQKHSISDKELHNLAYFNKIRINKSSIVWLTLCSCNSSPTQLNHLLKKFKYQFDKLSCSKPRKNVGLYRYIRLLQYINEVHLVKFNRNRCRRKENSILESFYPKAKSLNVNWVINEPVPAELLIKSFAYHIWNIK